jgi:5-methylcytosine-specific restriction endonuclease McrA
LDGIGKYKRSPKRLGDASFASSKKNNFRYDYKLLDERWRKRKLAVLAARGNKCEVCESTNAIQLHHLRYDIDKQPWEYEDCDLKLLCRQCHEKEHGR